jgi:hypothetical protein
MWYSFHDVNTIERFPIGIFEPPAIRDEFIRRKAILEGHVNSGKHFTASVQTKGAHKYVAFNEFVVWSGDQGWTSPDELKPVESTRTEPSGVASPGGVARDVKNVFDGKGQAV